MRKHRLFAIAVAATVTAAVMAPPAEAGVDWFGIGFRVGDVNVSLGYHDYPEYSDAWHDPYWQMDYDRMLDGYGEWVYVAGLGRVWRPYVRNDWRPYTHGRWVWSSYGWTWLSYEPWGYVPHHYGEWAYSPYGWVWTPGYSYSPANVVWCSTGSYVGWYPRAPRGWSHAHRGFWRGYDRGYDRGYRHGNRDGYDRGYGDGYWDGWDDAQYATWTDYRYMDSADISRHAVDPGYVQRSVGRSSVRALQTGPSRAEVQRHTGRSIREASVAEREVRVGDRTVRAVRLENMDGAVREHARATVSRGLAPEVGRKLEKGERVTREAREVQVRSANGRSVRETGRAAPERGPAVRERQQGPERTAPAVRERGGATERPRMDTGSARVQPAPRGTVRREPERSIERSAPPAASRPAPSRAPVRPEARDSRGSSTRGAPARPEVRRSEPPRGSSPQVDRTRRAPSRERGGGPVIVPPSSGSRTQRAPQAAPRSAPENGRSSARPAPTRREAPRATAPRGPERERTQARPAPQQQRSEKPAEQPERGRKPRKR